MFQEHNLKSADVSAGLQPFSGKVEKKSYKKRF